MKIRISDRFRTLWAPDIIAALRASGYQESEYIRQARARAKIRMAQADEKVVPIRKKAR